jgi:hypothetical protein
MNESKINDITLYDNTWRRWFWIKILNVARYMKIYAPYIFFMLVGLGGTRTANIIFDKYIADKINCVI